MSAGCRGLAEICTDFQVELLSNRSIDCAPFSPANCRQSSVHSARCVNTSKNSTEHATAVVDEECRGAGRESTSGAECTPSRRKTKNFSKSRLRETPQPPRSPRSSAQFCTVRSHCSIQLNIHHSAVELNLRHHRKRERLLELMLHGPRHVNRRRHGGQYLYPALTWRCTPLGGGEGGGGASTGCGMCPSSTGGPPLQPNDPAPRVASIVTDTRPWDDARHNRRHFHQLVFHLRHRNEVWSSGTTDTESTICSTMRRWTRSCGLTSKILSGRAPPGSSSRLKSSGWGVRVFRIFAVKFCSLPHSPALAVFGPL